jgi:hypothetical protein
MPPDELDKTEPQRLAEMLSIDAHDDERAAASVWQPAELAAILRHQLETELEFDLGDVSTELASLERIMGSGDAGAGTLRYAITFNQLLHHPRPSLALLERAKRFAKACKNAPSGALPPEVATVLYFAFLIVARMRCAARITALDDASLLRGLEWAIAQPWVDPETRALLRGGLEYLKQAV